MYTYARCSRLLSRRAPMIDRKEEKKKRNNKKKNAQPIRADNRLVSACAEKNIREKRRESEREKEAKG